MPDGSYNGAPNHPRLTLVTLGATALRATSDATLFDLGKPLALITYLCCAPDRSVPREHLIDLLWGDVEPDAAKHALRQTLWYIRKRLGDRTLIVGGDVLTVVAPVDSDRDRFLAAVGENNVEDVVRHYTGDFFPGFAAPGGAEFERWADIERQRMRAFFWRAAETLVRRWMSAGRLREAQALARRVRDSDPLREVGWRLMFETLIAAGDTVGGALEADAFDRLAEAEGIDAEPATRSMLRVVRQMPAVAPRQDAAGGHESLFAELVAREQEFARLLDRWEAARNGTATHVHVLAPAGLGKTRLLTDVHARLRATRARTLFVRASLGARDIPFGLAGDLAEALARFPGASGISTGSARALVALNPALSASYAAALPDAAGDSTDALRRRAVAVRELIAAVAEEQPVAIFIDDVQWADARSRQLIASVLGALDHARVLVVTASRPTVDGLSSGEQALTIRLAPLDVTGVQAFVASIAALPSELWAERLPEELRDATGGSPLLLLETLQLAIEGGMLARADGVWTAPRPSVLFATLGTGGALHQRVERLDRVERWVLTLLAVGGVPLTRDALTAAVGRTDDETASALGSLERRGLVARHGELWSPSHDEIAAKVVELAGSDAIRASARSLGRVMLDANSRDTRALRRAGGLLAQADDRDSLKVAFARFAHLARNAGDRQPNRALASDFLGERASDDLTREIVGSLPVLQRVGLFSTQRIVAAGAAIAGVPAALLLLGMLGHQPPPDVTLAVGSVGADSIANVYRVPIRASQLAVGSIVRVGGGRPAWRLQADPTSGRMIRRPDHKAWTVDRVANDSGGIDLFDVGDDGHERRLTATAGDDAGGRWSPDGRWLAFSTARWNAESHYDIAILEARSGAVRSLTRSGTTDAAPVWSPDGSRIAFDRRYWDGRPRAACVIDVDGRNERCFTAPGAELSPYDAWYDPTHVVVYVARGATAALGRLDVTSGTIDTVVALRRTDALWVSGDGRWVMCQCRRVGYSASAVLLFPLEDPNRVVEIDVSRVKPGRRILAFESTSRSPRYAEHLSIGTGLGQPMVGVPHQLVARGITPDRDTISLGSLRWSSPDSAIASLDSTGLMVVRRPGIVRVMVTAGGWRTAWRDVAVRQRETAMLFHEDWSGSLAERWQPFGVPRPRIDSATDGVRGLMNNGDGSFSSGAYSLAKYPTANGLALDAWLSTPLTKPQWQVANVSLDDALTETVLETWDHGAGNMPRRSTDWPSCSAMYPTSEGPAYADSIASMFAGSSSTVTALAPPSFRTGAWFHVRLQIFPDGRCGVAVNGVPTVRGQFGTIPDSVERVVIFGNSSETKVLVGPLTIRSGVPNDIDWAQLGKPIPAVPPPGWSPRPEL
jgi:DNA-binding SARP family transcriptional activator